MDEDYHDKKHKILGSFLLIGIIYPITYDLIQAWRTGFVDYTSDIWNWIDILYNGSCAVLFGLHMFGDPFDQANKGALQTVVFLGMGKTLFFLRLFHGLSPIVTMLINVIADLKVFIFFFLILVVLFSL